LNRSLQKRLSYTLIVTVLIGGVLATLAAFYFAYSEAEEFQDDTLKQIAALAADSRPTSKKENTDTTTIEDPESRVQVIRVPGINSPTWLPRDIAPGFHTLPAGENVDELRIFVRTLSRNKYLVVAQPTASRDEIAINSALRTLIPLLVLIPILIGIISMVTRSEFESVSKLSEHLDRKATDLLVSLPDSNIPQEITPFVHAINRLLQRVDQLINTQRRFIADAAHELRTPLTALSLQAQNLAEAKSLESMQERLIPLREGIERARRLTVQLLDLARLQSGEVQMESVDIFALAREVIAELYPIAVSKSISINVDNTGVGVIHSSPQALKLIFRNGLENALKYSPDDTEITIKISVSDRNVLMEILDPGPGLEEEAISHVFDPFFRLPDAKGEGSGLGLAIAMEAASRVGGVLELRNRTDGPGIIYHYRQSTSAI